MAAELAASTIDVGVGAGDESRTRDPGCPQGSNLLGKLVPRVSILLEAPDARFGPSWP